MLWCSRAKSSSKPPCPRKARIPLYMDEQRKCHAWDHDSFTIATKDCDTFLAPSGYGSHMKTVQAHIPNAPYHVAHRPRYAPLQISVRRPHKHSFRRIALRGAYAFLAVITIGMLILDHFNRKEVANSPSFNPNSASVSSAPFPITPLADSPFLKKSSRDSVAAVSAMLEKSKQGVNRLDANGGNRG